MTIVNMQNITVKYGNHTVIDKLSLEVKRGEILSIVGPSSCGKTTLMRALCGFIKISNGEISVRDTIVSKPSRHIMVPPEKRKIGVVFQDYAVWPHLTVFENIMYPMKKRKLPKEEAQRKVYHALEQVKMKDFAQRLPAQLSGGQQQRVALARALVSSSELIVLDEPITNLDATLREEMAYEIRGLQETIGVTVVYITHDQETAMTISDRMVIMDRNGAIRQIGTPEEIWNHPIDRSIYQFLGVSNFLPVKRDGDHLRMVNNPSQSINLGNIMLPENSTSPYLLLASRPMDIRLHAGHEKPGMLYGTVKRVTYLGNQFDYFVQVEGQTLRIQEDSLEAFRKGVPEVGSNQAIELLNPSLYEHDDEEIYSVE